MMTLSAAVGPYERIRIWTFLLSFAVIIRPWLAHHRGYRHVRAYSTPLVLALAVPGVNYWALLILLLAPVVESAWLRHRGRRGDLEEPGREAAVE